MSERTQPDMTDDLEGDGFGLDAVWHHPACDLGLADHPGYLGYRCVDADGRTLPFPGEPS